eukprot:118990-Rhodomonas_salina.1
MRAHPSLILCRRSPSSPPACASRAPSPPSSRPPPPPPQSAKLEPRDSESETRSFHPHPPPPQLQTGASPSHLGPVRACGRGSPLASRSASRL